MTIFRIFLSTILIFLSICNQTNAFPLERDKLQMSFEVILNTTTDHPLKECESKAKVDGKKNVWWVSFAKVLPDAEKGWKKSDNELRCGVGSFDKGSLDSKAPPGVPYLIAEFTMVAFTEKSILIPEKLLRQNIILSLQKLKGFDAQKEPVYDETVQKRTFFHLDQGNIFIPLLIADSMEQETLGIYEVFIKNTLKREKEKPNKVYGTILVTSGSEEGELYLDGGVIGNIPADKEMTLRNIPEGLREIKLRVSDNDIRKAVRVIANRTVLVNFDLSETVENKPPFRLESIGKNAQGYEEYLRKSDNAVVVKIPAGEFLMGNKETERSPLEHKVFVSDFLIDKKGVTWQQYKKFAETTGRPLPVQEPYWGMHDNHPAVYVTWEDAKNYCEWSGARLPTEAEREKAARGTDGRKFPWGNEAPDPQRAVFRRNWGKEATAAVETHQTGVSPYGLEDMGGNVWEWCSDWYDNDYYKDSPYRDPKGPSTGIAHVLRGGSWDSRPDVLSASCRNWGSRGYREGDFGFRCAMDIQF